MEQWEYKVECLAHRGGEKQTEYKPGETLRYLWELDLEKQLNKLGAEGWEIVEFPSALLNGYCIGWALFKRKKIEE